MQISVSHSQKRPVSGMDFSSVSAGIHLTREIGEGASLGEITALAQDLFAQAKTIVEAELSQTQAAPVPSHPANGTSGGGNGGNGGSAYGKASTKQLNYLVSLAKKNGGMKELEKTVLARFGTADLSALSRANCSSLIDQLRREATHAHAS